jgi:hypothetical protein
MSFLTYESTRPWVSVIREAVRLGKMPPWGADGVHGSFRNDPRLSAAEREVLISWAEAKAPAGDPADAPPPVVWRHGWNIGMPDLVLAMPTPYEVPANGTVNYLRFVIPLNFKEDRWITAAEVRPGNRAVVHHAVAEIREPGSKWLESATYGVPVEKKQVEDPLEPEEFIGGYSPGYMPQPAVPGRGRLVKAGSDLVLEVHYTPNGKMATDQTSVGLILAKERPGEVVRTVYAINMDLVIPPHASSAAVRAKWVAPRDVRLVELTPHMHLRGKDFEYTAYYPNGEHEVLLRVPRYDFAWQHTYVLALPKLLPKGAVIECIAHYDNSRSNARNPDPARQVRWGDQSWDEMMIGYMTVVYDSEHAKW